MQESDSRTFYQARAQSVGFIALNQKLRKVSRIATCAYEIGIGRDILGDSGLGPRQALPNIFFIIYQDIDILVSSLICSCEYLLE